MPDQNNKDDFKNPNEDSMVTSNSLAGKKVDANPDNESERPSDENNLITQQSQKGKKVDGDPELDGDKPSQE